MSNNLNRAPSPGEMPAPDSEMLEELKQENARLRAEVAGLRAAQMPDRSGNGGGFVPADHCPSTTHLFTSSTFEGGTHEWAGQAVEEPIKHEASEEPHRESEINFRSLFELAGVGICDVDPATRRFLRVNPRYCEITGYTEEELLERTIDDLDHPEDQEEDQKRFREYTTGIHQVLDTEKRYIRKDGTTVWVNVNATLVRDAVGTPISSIGAVQDVSARKAAERALFESEQRFRMAIDHFPNAFVIYDAERRLRYVNTRTIILSGLPEEALIGRRDEEVVPESGTRRYLHVLKRAFETKQAQTVEFNLPAKLNGGVVVSTYVPILDEDGAIHQVLGISRDITQEKRAEELLRKAKEEAEAANRMKSIFLANMSHEIRTPLTGILGFASLLMRTLDGKPRTYAEFIERSGKRLNETLNAVLTLARLEAGTVDMNVETLHVGMEAAEIIGLYRQEAEKKRLKLDLDVAPEALHACARLDRGALNSILQNLIANAIKFTDAGIISVRVETDDASTPRDDSASQRVMIHVEDTGSGVAPEFLPYLFDPFQQESTGLDRTHEGSGLGLSIVRQLTERMQGAITVESRKERGTRFTVSFPCVPDPRAEHDPRTEDPALPAGSHRRYRVLVVEDQEDSRILLDALLQDIAAVALAANAVSAIEAAQHEVASSGQSFDLVLIDINLGAGPDGIAVLNSLRSLPAYRDVPIAALTAYALPGDEERFLRLGFDEYLRKPFSADEFEAMTMRLLSRQEPPPVI